MVAEFSTMLEFLKALANESRLRLLGLLARQEHSVSELASLLSLSGPTVSHHLAVLRRAALVQKRADGNTHWYRLHADALMGLARSLLSREEVATLAPAPDSNASVLRNFVSADGVLLQIPASRKKRWAVLAWLAEKFKTGRSYSEAEVNRTIKRHHEDSATLRREMVGYGMMVREAGRYQLMPASAWRPA